MRRRSLRRPTRPSRGVQRSSCGPGWSGRVRALTTPRAVQSCRTPSSRGPRAWALHRSYPKRRPVAISPRPVRSRSLRRPVRAVALHRQRPRSRRAVRRTRRAEYGSTWPPRRAVPRCRTRPARLPAVVRSARRRSRAPDRRGARLRRRTCHRAERGPGRHRRRTRPRSRTGRCGTARGGRRGLAERRRRRSGRAGPVGGTDCRPWRTTTNESTTGPIPIRRRTAENLEQVDVDRGVNRRERQRRAGYRPVSRGKLGA